MAGIVSDEQQAKLMSEYDKWISTSAPELQPQPMGIDPSLPANVRQANWAKYNEDLAKFRSNPGFLIREKAKKKILDSLPPGAKPEDEQVKSMIDLELAANRKAYEAGLNEGVKDGSHINNAMNALFQFPPQIFTAIKQLFLSIPLVGDALAAGGKSLMSLFSGKPINPLTAYDHVKTERAMAGGLSRLGITDKPTLDYVIPTVVSGGGFPGMPQKVIGKAYVPNAPEVADDFKKIKDSAEAVEVYNSTQNLQIMTVNGSDGKPLMVMGSRSGDSFTIKGVFKTGDDGKLVKLDARQPDGRSIEGESITLVGGAIADIGRGMITDAAARVTQAGKAYSPNAPEVSQRVAMAKSSGIDVKDNSRIIVTKDSAGKDIVLIGTISGESFKVDAVLKASPDGTSLVKAIKQPEGTMPMAGETITLSGGALPAEAATKLKGEVDTIKANEIKSGKMYAAGSQEVEFKQLKSKLFAENPAVYNKIQNEGMIAVAIKDEKGAFSALAVGRIVGNKFVPEQVLKADAEGKFKEVKADVIGVQLDIVPNSAALSDDALKALKASVEKKFRADGREIVEMSPTLREAAEDYAKARFTNLETGEVDQGKVDKFMEIYTRRVIEAGMPEAAQKARAAAIKVRTEEARLKFASAKESAELAEKNGATLDNPADEKYKPMMGAIQEALDILAGKKSDKPLDDSLEAAFKEFSPADLPPAPSTPVKATSKGLGLAANKTSASK